ncbi:mucin-2 [Chanodichthys erythropterus]|uniref:mucin-2 n=1 Tax=Chanodichthys erythropterus TaxID=933992 RepID=UPI00351F3A62
MGATASSAKRDSRCEEDAAEEELTAAASDAQDDGSPDDKLLQKNGQISRLNVKTSNHADELNGQFEERVLADVGSGFVTLKEDGTETTEGLQDMDALQPNIKNESTEIVNADGVEPEEDNQVNDINEVGFKKIFKFVGFKFTLKKDTCEKTEANEQEERVASPSEDSSDTQENSAVATNENITDETQKSEVTSQADAAETSQQTDNETELDQDIKLEEHHVEDTPEKEMEKKSPEPEEQMSPFKQFFTQGIFASLRKKRKEEEIEKENKEEELKRIEKTGAEEAEHEDSKCMCLDIPYILSEEEKDSPEKADDKLLPERELQNIQEKDKVQGSPLKRLFRKFSTRRQRESNAAEKVVEAEEQVSEQPKPTLELTEQGKLEEPVIEELKPAEEELVANESPQESKKKSDTTVSWEALICGGSSKKRARKTNEDETAEKGREYEKTTDSPLGSSFEGDYEHLTSSGSPAEGEMGSTWKTFKKMVTPKRKVRTGESSTPEQIPSDSEMNKDDSFSMKKLIPGHKKRKSEGRQEQTSSDEAAKDHETGDEDDETPAIIPLSEYEIIEPESLKEVNEQRVEITIEHEIPEMTSQVLEQDTSDDLVPEIAAKVSSNTGPTVIHGLSEDFEELTDFVSKHQQLSDIPEEGIIEESIETPVSSAEWTTQDDTLAEDIVELTADAVTAPEPASEQFGDDTTEMVSAVSQLTESPRTSGRVTPVPAEYSVQTSEVILQEAIQSICMTPSVQSVTTKDEIQESLAVSFSPYILQSSTPEETKVLVAHKKTEATAMCTGLVSQEIESVEEHLPAHIVEAIPEVSDAVPTELVSDNFTDEPEAAGLGTDEVYEAEIKDVKTEYKEIIVNEEESATETQLEVEQVIQLVSEPLVEESEETHMEDETEECTTAIELRQVIDTMHSEAYTHGPETECRLYSELEEPVYEQPLAAEPEKELKLPDAEFEQAALNEGVETLTHGVVDNIPDTTTSKASDVPEEEIEMTASAVECLESKDTVSIIHPSLDHMVAEELKLEDNLEVEVESIHADVCEIQVDVKDAVLLAGDSAVTVEDISEKMNENNDGKITQQEIKEIHVEEETGDVVASDTVQNIEAENISETVDESLAREQFLAKEVSLPESILVEEAEEIHKEDIDTNVDNNKVEDSASDRMDRIFVKEEDDLAVKEGQPSANTASIQTDNQDVSAHTNITDESPEITITAGTENGDMVHRREPTVVPEFSKDVFDHAETPAELKTKCEVIQAPLETALSKAEARPLPTEIVASQTEEWGEDTKHIPEPHKENEQPVTTENIKTGKVLEMVAIIENTTKQSGKEKLIMVEPVAQALKISELPKATEQEGDASEMTVVHAKATDDDQAPEMTSTLMKETTVSEEKDTMAVAEPEPTVIEVAATTVLAQNDTASQMEVSNVSECKNEAEEDVRLKCEPLEQLIETTLPNKLQVDKAEIKDEIPAVMEVKPITQVPPLSSEVTAEMADVSVSEIQTQVVSELRAATLEVTEPKVEMPVVTEVEVETAVVTELEVETPIVTSVVTELEVEMPVVTFMAKTIDTNNSVSPQNQNIYTDTSMLTTVIKEQVGEMSTVVVTPATPLGEVTSAVTLGKESVEIQNVIPVVAAPDLGSVLVTEAASSVLRSATVTTVAETAVVSTAEETLVVSFTAVKPTPAVVAEMPAAIEKTNMSPVVEIPAIQTPTVGPVIMSSAVTSVVETPSQVIETPLVSITSVKPTVATLTQTPVVEIPAIIPVTVTDAVSSVVATSAVTSVESEKNVTLVVETPTVSSIAVAETSPVTTVEETPAQISVIVTEAEPPVPPAATSAAETLAMIPVVEVVKSTPVVVVQTPVVSPVVETPGPGSVIVKETASTVCSAVTAAVETPIVIPVVETPVLKSAPLAVVETPVLTPVVQTPHQVLVTATEAAPPVVVSSVASAAKTPVVIPVVETSAVKPAPLAMVETPVLPPLEQTPHQVLVTATEAATPVVVSAMALAAEAPIVIPVVETPAVKPAPLAVVETPVVTPVIQTPHQVLVTATESAPPVVVSAMASAAEAPIVIPVVETPAAKPAPLAVVETPVVTPVVQTPHQVLVTATEAATPVVVSAVASAAETPVVIPAVETPAVKPAPIAVVETPVLTPVVQTPHQVLVTVTEAAPPVVVSAVASAAETPVVIPAVETPAVKPAPIAVVETPVLTPVVQTPHQVLVTATEAAPPVVVSSVASAAKTPVVIPVVETSAVKPAPLAMVETPVLPPVVQTPHQVLVTATEAAPPVVVSAMASAAEGPIVIPIVETTAVKPAPLAMVEAPVVTPVVQTPHQVLVTATEAAPQIVVSAMASTAEAPIVIPVVETPAVKPAPLAMVETPVVTPVVQTPHQVLVTVTEAAPQVVVSAVASAAETPVVIPVVETPAVKPAPIAVVETPVLPPVVQTPHQVLVTATEAAPPVVVSAVASAAEKPVVIPVVETSAVKPASLAVVETPVVTSVVQTPHQVLVTATEAAPPVVVSAMASAAEKPVVIPVVETSAVKPASLAVVETPVVTQVVQTPHQVLVTIAEAAPQVVVSSVISAAETPVVVETPVVKPTPIAVAETPVLTSVMMTPTVTSIAESSVVTLVQETTVGAVIAVADRPVRIPVVQTPGLVSVIVKEAAPPVVLPAVSPIVETQGVKPTVAMAETPVPGIPVAEASAVTPAVQTLVVEQIVQTPTTPAVPLVKATPVVTVIETPPVTTVEDTPQETLAAQTPALAPLKVTPAISPVVGTAAEAPFVVTPEVKEAMLLVVEQGKTEAKATPSVVSDNAEPPLVTAKEVKTSISPEENTKSSLQHDPQSESQSEVEDDVWEDAVDIIGDSQGLVKQASDAAI